MSLLVLGLSHHDAPLSLLEGAFMDDEAAGALEGALLASDHISEAIVLSTCNRTEIYTESATFHGALSDATAALSAATGLNREALAPHLFVHYEERAIDHVFVVAAGLDSMAIGEAQILGQVRRALVAAQARGHVGPALNALLQQAIHVAKRVHTETGIDEVSGSLIQAGLDEALALLARDDLPSVLVVGAGGMGSLAAHTVARRDPADLTILNRDAARAVSLAERTGGRSLPFSDLPAALAAADIVISSTGARGTVIDAADVAAALAARGGAAQVYIDLALPHDVDPGVGDLAGAHRVGLDAIGAHLANTGASPQVDAARDLVAEQVAAYLVTRTAQALAPTVTALRARGSAVVADELKRLARRLPDLDEDELEEVRHTLQRVVDKLLHTPTVRAKQLAGDPAGTEYLAALAELFDLSADDARLVSTPPALPGDAP